MGTPEPPVPPKASTLLHSACGFKDQLAHGAAPGVCRIIQNLARMGIKRICLCACGLRVHHSGVGVGVPTGLSLPTPSCVMSVGGASAPPPSSSVATPCTVPLHSPPQMHASSGPEEVLVRSTLLGLPGGGALEHGETLRPQALGKPAFQFPSPRAPPPSGTPKLSLHPSLHPATHPCPASIAESPTGTRGHRGRESARCGLGLVGRAHMGNQMRRRLPGGAQSPRLRLVKGDSASQLGGLTGGEGRWPRPRWPGSVTAEDHAPRLCTEPLHQAHPCLPGKADESTPGDKELSRTRLATPNHRASATAKSSIW